MNFFYYETKFKVGDGISDFFYYESKIYYKIYFFFGRERGLELVIFFPKNPVLK